MTAKLSELPLEILLLIAKNLDHATVVRLSTACTALRTRLASRLYESVSFMSDDASAGPALTAAKRHGEHIREVRLVVILPDSGLLSVEAPRFVCFDEIVFCTARGLLAGYNTPNLQRLRISIHPKVANYWSSVHDGFSTVRHDVGRDRIARLAMRESWNRFYDGIWQALSMNMHITALVLHSLIPAPSSIFAREDFQALLGRLHRFEVSIFDFGGRSGIKKSSTLQDLIHFHSQFGRIFLDHMRSLRTLQIHASNSVPWGCRGRGMIRLPLNRTRMPHLHTLELENCFVGPELIEFIQRHRASLKRLGLASCYCRSNPSSGSGGVESDMSWRAFFSELIDMSTNLRSLDISPLWQPLTCIENYTNMEYYTDDAYRSSVSVAAKIRRTLEEDPTRRLFGYAWFANGNGGFTMDHDMNRRMFNEGGDSAAYRKLCELIHRNGRS